MQAAKLAKGKLHGKLVCGRPLVVRLASEKYLMEMAENSAKSAGEASKSGMAGSSLGHTSRTAKIAAIKSKLKAMEDESHDKKRQKQDKSISRDDGLDPSSVKRKG